MNLKLSSFHKNQIKYKSNWKIARYFTKSTRLNIFVVVFVNVVVMALLVLTDPIVNICGQ